MTHNTINPYANLTDGKKTQVALMFNNIAKHYDFLNHFLSLGIDTLWRRKAIRILRPSQPREILDIATGTGDFAIEALRLQPTKVVGIDISVGMLQVGQEKIAKRKLDHLISLHEGDSEHLAFPEASFDAITAGFGVRNFENLDAGLAEMFRVLRPGGKLVILEFSKPKKFPVKQFYNLYFTQILPRLGKTISKDDSAYTYLPKSVYAFPDREDFLARLDKLGFTATHFDELTFGIACIYTANKPK